MSKSPEEEADNDARFEVLRSVPIKMLDVLRYVCHKDW
jgi:hypothetical protein